MSDDAPDEMINEQLVLISGESGSGKTASLRNLPNQERWMFLNCEAGKRPPMKNKFDMYKITDPYQVYDGMDHAKSSDHVGVIIDTATFLMEMYETNYVLNAANTMKAWSDYGQFFKTLMQDKVASLGKPVIILAHTKSVPDDEGIMRTSVPVKGALQNNGIEAYFSTVVSTKKIPLTNLDTYKNGMLHITEDDEIVGFKNVFQTRLTKKTVGERIRSPLGMFTKEETYIDNDVKVLLDHMKEFYA